MFSIQQLINVLRRLQMPRGGNNSAVGRNEAIKNLRDAIGTCVNRRDDGTTKAPNQLAVSAVTATATSVKATAASSSSPSSIERTYDDNNSELKVNNTRETLTVPAIWYCSDDDKCVLNNDNNNGGTNNVNCYNIKSEKNNNAGNNSSQVQVKKSRSMTTTISEVATTATAEIQHTTINVVTTTATTAAIAATATARLSPSSTPIHSKTSVTEAERVAEAESEEIRFAVVAGRESELSCYAQPFSYTLCMKENGANFLKHCLDNYLSENRFNKNCTIRDGNINEIKNETAKEDQLKSFYRNSYKSRQHPQTSNANTCTASALAYSQGIQNFYQQYQSKQQHQFYHIRIQNPSLMDSNENMNNKQNEISNSDDFATIADIMAIEYDKQQRQQQHHQQQQQSNINMTSNMLENAAAILHSVSMSSNAPSSTGTTGTKGTTTTTKIPSTSCSDNQATGRPCFNTNLSDILKFMELIGNLKHTKRTGWVLRDVNDCESISGHMYRMSILTFLLDGSEGLNQTRCMELALVHDLAESLVGDITPFCGVSKVDKRAMEFKAMEDICKLIEPRGKRIMELFEEYELGESPESQFVKDLDRLDMVMQAFEYEKRDNCLLKHQEFFDSTAGKFKHPFVKKLINEIYEQRNQLAKAKGATLPPKIDVPNMELNATNTSNHNIKYDNSTVIKGKTKISETTTTPTIGANIPKSPTS